MLLNNIINQCTKSKHILSSYNVQFHQLIYRNKALIRPKGLIIDFNLLYHCDMIVYIFYVDLINLNFTHQELSIDTCFGLQRVRQFSIDFWDPPLSHSEKFLITFFTLI